MRALAAFAFASVAAAAAPAPVAFTSEDAQLLAASARSHPRDMANQATVDVSRKLGAAGNLEALDYMLQLGHPMMVATWTSGFRESNRDRLSPEIEERLVRVYDDDRLAWALMQGIERYESPALADRLVDDTIQLAGIREERARKCRVAFVKPTPPADPKVRTIESMRAQGGGLGIVGSSAGKPMPRLQCPPDMAAPTALNRRELAVRLVGNTSLPGVVERVAPHIRSLARSPPIDQDARGAPGIAPGVGNVGSIASIARLAAATGYARAGPELVAALENLEGKSAVDFQAAHPILQSIAAFDQRDGTVAIAKWTERRLVAPIPANADPQPWGFTRLLYGVLPQGQIDLAQARDRVLPNVPSGLSARVTEEFERAISANRALSQADPQALIYWARSGGVRQARYLLSKGVNPDTRGPRDETPLTVSVPHQWQMQKLLVESGASPDLPGEGGVTPFLLAVRGFGSRGDDDDPAAIPEYYRLRGANINSSASGQTPLHVAAALSLESTRYLLRHKAALEAKASSTHREAAPLHVAVLNGKVDIAEALLDAGANVNAEMKDSSGLEGLRPLQIARDSKNAAMEAMLVKRGANANYAYLAKRTAMEAAALAVAPFLRMH